MKNLIKILTLTVGISLLFAACNKEGDLPVYKTGNGTVVSSSVSTVTPQVADSNANVLTINWTWPNYATDTANQKFVVQIDQTGNNFAAPVELVYKGVTKATLTGKALNQILFGFGVSTITATDLDIRVISSYNNNNDLYQSNIIKVTASPYIIPVTLVTDPTEPLTLLMANASSTAVTCNWNPTWYGNLPLNYAVEIQKQGNDWTSPIVKIFGEATTGIYSVTNLNRAAVAVGVAPNTTGTLEFRVIAYQGTDFANPVYSNVTSLTVTTYLDEVKFFVVGSYNGWDNSDNAATLMNTPTSGSLAEGYVNFPASGEFKLTTDHSWDDPHTFGDDGSNSGKLKNPGGNIPVAEEGYYQVKADIMAMTYTLTKTVWGIIGTSTPGGWSDQTNMTYNPELKIFSLGIHMPSGEFKFRGTPTWSINYGCTAGDGKTLNADGTNIPIANEDDYAITLDLSHANAYTFSANRWGIIGSATADGWNSDQNMSWDAANGVFTATLPLTVGEFKFRANDDWGINFGGSLSALVQDGANLQISEAGTYKITLNPWFHTATVAKIGK